jgi:hypothetical protein
MYNGGYIVGHAREFFVEASIIPMLLLSLLEEVGLYVFVGRDQITMTLAKMAPILETCYSAA